jgi:hypothetical protein
MFHPEHEATPLLGSRSCVKVLQQLMALCVPTWISWPLESIYQCIKSPTEKIELPTYKKVDFGWPFIMLVLWVVSLFLHSNSNSTYIPFAHRYEMVASTANAITSHKFQTMYNFASSPLFNCTSNFDCSHGTCEVITNISGGIIGAQCVCNCDYATIRTEPCAYERVPGLTLLLLSILLGLCGIDRCFLAGGHGCGCCLGILKGLTGGGLTIWYWIDIAFVAQGKLTDPNGVSPSRISC